MFYLRGAVNTAEVFLFCNTVYANLQTCMYGVLLTMVHTNHEREKY